MSSVPGTKPEREFFAMSVSSHGDRWIEARRTPGRDVRGKRRNAEEHHDRRRINHEVGGIRLKEQTANQASAGPRPGTSENDSDGGEPQRLAEHERRDHAVGCAERFSNAEL